MKSETWYYIKLIPLDTKDGKCTHLHHYMSTICGYTRNHWIAMQYLKSLQQMMRTEFSNGIPFHIFSMQCYGTLSQFYDMLKTEYGIVITGEDLLDVFSSDDGIMTIVPPVSVITTSGDIFGNKWCSCMEHSFLYNDCNKIYSCLLFLSEILNFLRGGDYRDKINDTIDILYQHPVMKKYLRDNYGIVDFYDYDDNFLCIDQSINMVLYGMLKGRFFPI